MRVKTLSLRKDPRLNDDSISQTHATVRFTTERVVTSGVKPTWAMSKWRKIL